MTEKQFLALLEPMQSGLFGFAFRMLRDQDDAQDALQELTYRLWKKRKQLKTNQNIRSYCFTAMNHICIDTLRKREPETGIQESSDHGSRITDHENGDLVQRIREAVNQLPYKQRVIIELHDFQEFTYPEISAMLNMEVNAIRTNLSRARAKLAKQFEKEYHEG